MEGNKEGEEGEWNRGNTRVNRRHSLMESFGVVSVPPLICVASHHQSLRRFKNQHYFFKTCLLLILCLFTALRSEFLDQNGSVTACSKTTGSFTVSTLTKLWFSWAKYKKKKNETVTFKIIWQMTIQAAGCQHHHLQTHFLLQLWSCALSEVAQFLSVIRIIDDI